MSLYPTLPLILVAAGLALMSALTYLAHLVRVHRRAIGALLKLSNLDPLQLPVKAWPVLATGGIMRLEYSGNWFGQPVQESLGTAQPDSHPFSFNICADTDISLDFKLYAKTGRGEAKLFAENLAGVFRLLLETSVHSKMESLSTALNEQAKLSLYLQHDLRNLAQWVEWLAADLAATPDKETLLHLARRLKHSAPQAAARAKQILNASCKVRINAPQSPQEIELNQAIAQAADHAGIAIHIEGDARICLRRDLLERTLDNLFTNVAPLLRQHADLCVRVEISQQQERIRARIDMPHLAEIASLPAENLFEPFASGRPGGLGLGLYQAHQSMNEAGGELLATLREKHVSFLLILPA